MIFRGATGHDRQALVRGSGSAGGKVARVAAALAREPLVHFLVLAALLFAAYALLDPPGENRIVIDRAAVDRVVAEQETVLARPLSEKERETAIRSLIDQEVLLREAYRRGLDQDAVVRRHLVQKMRLILGEDQAEPSEAELRAFLESNRERYRTPPTVTLREVFYADPAKVPANLLARLRAGAEPDDIGDGPDMLGPTPTRYSLRDLIGPMGPEVARRIFELPPGAWDGPFSSDRGVHFVRVLGRHPPALPPFEEIADSLRQDWFFARQEEAVAARLGKLRAGYRIVVEDRAGTP
jgi:hypothetical protein